MSLPTLTTPLTSTPLALSVEGGGGGGARGGGGFGSCHDGGADNSGSLGRPGISLVAMLGIVGGPGGRAAIAGVVPGRPGVAPGRPGVAPGRPAGPVAPGRPAGPVAPGRPGVAPGRPAGPVGCRPVVPVPVGKPGTEGSPGIDDAGFPGMFGESAGLLAPGRPGGPWGRAEIGDLHCGGIEVNGKLGRLAISAGLCGLGSSAIVPRPPGPPVLARCTGIH